MPKYQYTCMVCDLDLEKERAITDAEPRYICEQCGYALIRVYSSVGVTFKGKGFYKTDNRQLSSSSSSCVSVTTSATATAATAAAAAGAITPSEETTMLVPF